MMLDSLFKQIQQAEVVSFDVFDTLILRPYIHPNDTFKHIEKVYDIPGFCQNRIDAESKAWDKYVNDEMECTNLDEIYSEIKKEYKKYKNIEQEFELQISTKNPQLYQAYLYAVQQKKKIIAVSDMYFDQKLIQSMLKKNGYDKIDKVYVSSDCRKLKKTGNLFKYVLQDLNVDPEKVLHIGDNVDGDNKVPKKLGMKTYLYETVLSQYKKAKPRVEKFISKNGADLGASIIVGLNAINYAEKPDCKDTESYWKNFGFEYTGPACYAFLNWVKEQSKNVKDIIFLARDGYILEKIYNKISNQKTHYIYTPRSLNLICLLNYETTGQFALEHTKTIIEFYRNRSELLKDAPEVQTAEEGVNYIESNKEIFKKLAKQELNNYIKYLEKQNIDGKNVIAVDTVSMFYSGQVLLQKLMPQKKIYGLYYLIQHDAKDSKFVKTFKSKSYYAPDLKLIEFMMSSPEPPIQSIEKDKPVYKKNISVEEERRSETTKLFCQGACNFADVLLAIFGKDIDVYITPEIITDWIMHFVNNPMPIDKQMFLETRCAYDPQHSIYDPVYPEWYKQIHTVHKTRLLLFGLIDYTYKQWPQKSKYQFCGLTLLICKWTNASKVYKLFGVLPIFKKQTL